MAITIEPLQPDWIPALGRFLREGFHAPPDAVFAAPDVLEWKYFDPRPGVHAPSPRSFVLRESGDIVAHIGLTPTSFVTLGSTRREISTLHTIHWLAMRGGAGAVLMRRALREADVQYVLGPTEEAGRVMRGVGYKVINSVPLFQKVLRARAWGVVHGRGQPLWRRAAKLAVDLSRSVRVPLPQPATELELKSVSEFGGKVEGVLDASFGALTLTSRAPALLNHYLRFPRKTITGWQLHQGERLRGLCLLSVVSRGGVRVGKIVDCLLDSHDRALWQTAVFGLTEALRKQGCDLIWCHGSTPWLVRALGDNGFFPRGRTPFYLRDPGSLVPRSAPFHLTYLEGNLAYL